MQRDRFRLRRQLQRLKAEDDKSRVEQDISTSEAEYAHRLQHLPKPTFPEALPVSEKHEEIAQAIAAHQVVIVCGETGSGKTTQIPKICLSLGRGVAGMIGHTQPRRIAARSVAARIAEELNSGIGQHVGYKVRFSDQQGENTYIKLMTDGILLAETQNDRFLDAYDTIIIDEAHERSLNIDFLLGYLKQLLPRRPDLKVIVTSATIDPQRFSKHFNNAPVIEVSGRTFPVEMRYRPFNEDRDDERDLQQAIIDAIDELSRQGPGDVLVFLSGERDIRETAEALRKHHPPHTEILPLFARLTVAEQQKIFQSHAGRRIVLSTNVAETSLTVPGIRYVVDTGFARISRYSYRSKIQRLPVEAISQASANQRAGRCGRVSAGICIRLYSEEDYLNRDEFTDAEILRTNLASVILQMTALGLGDVKRFPFVDKPDDRFINDGYKLLQELNAIDDQRRLTKTGKLLSKLPIEPRLARVLVEGDKENSLHEVLIIVAGLSVQDPRERPFDAQQAADEKHRRFQDEDSDFIALLKLWDYLSDKRRHLSNSQYRKLCRAEFLSYMRVKEWREVYTQLKKQAIDLGLKVNQEAAHYDAIHRALLSGLLSRVGMKDEDKGFFGARNSRFFIFPGSSQFKKPPKWVIAAEIVETAKVYARMVAKINPDWIEPLALHVVKRSHVEPHWEKRHAQVAAFENVSLFGLPVVNRRRVNYGPIDPETSREIFIRHALVYGEYQTDAAFFKHNRELIEKIESLEAKSRRQDILVDEQLIYDFFDQRIPAGIFSGATFEKWRKQLERAEPQLLLLSEESLMQHQAGHVTENRFPSSVNINGLQLALEYHFAPGEPEDGVSVKVPVAALSQLRPQRFEWLVPGLLEDKIVAMIKSLPKSLRKNFVPAPQYAQACVEVLTPDEISLRDALSKQLLRMTGVKLEDENWKLDSLPMHFLMNFRVVDSKGKLLMQGRDLAQLQQQLGSKTEAVFSGLNSSEYERSDIREWDFGDLPPFIEVKHQGVSLKAFPTLVEEQGMVALRLVDSPDKAEKLAQKGLRALFMACLSQQQKYLRKNLPGVDNLCLQYRKIGDCERLKQDILAAVFDQVFLFDRKFIRTRAEFQSRLEQGRGELIERANTLCALLRQILELYTAIEKSLKGSIPANWINAVSDIRQHLNSLVFKDFISTTPLSWLEQYPRYLRAVEKRIEKLALDINRDRTMMMDINPLWEQYLTRKERHEKLSIDDPELTRYRWLIEEFRVSLFAQELKTLEPVSLKRLEKQWQSVRKE